MNCECFYILKNQTIEGAREFAKEVDRVVKMRCEEVYPVCISKVIKDFYATSDYDNFTKKFKVTKGTWLVFVQGKYHGMCAIRPKGGKRGFVHRFEHPDFLKDFNEYIEDVEEIKSSFFDED